MTIRLLVVEDDYDFRNILQASIQTSNEIKNTQYVCDTAGSVDEAKDLISSQKYRLIISDLKMPNDGDGLKLLNHLNDIGFDGKFIAMTGMHDENTARQLLKMGAANILYKPFSIQALIQTLPEYLEEKPKNNLQDIDLRTLIQLINIEKKTITINVYVRGHNGKLFFVKGELIHAEYEDLKGKEACEIILNTSSNKEFSFTKEISAKKTINMPLMNLLLLISKDNDEKNKENKEKKNKETQNKKTNVNIDKLKGAMETLKKDMGEALITSDITMIKEGQILISHNPDPKLCALTTLMIQQIIETVNKTKDFKLGNKIILRLEDNKSIITLFYGDYLWSMMVDKDKIQIGLVLNAIIPDTLKNLEIAVNA